MDSTSDSGLDEVTMVSMETKLDPQYIYNTPSNDILCFIRERDIARAETARVEVELDKTRSKLYDMAKRVENLEKQQKPRTQIKSVKKKKSSFTTGDTLDLPGRDSVSSSFGKNLSSCNNSPSKHHNLMLSPRRHRAVSPSAKSPNRRSGNSPNSNFIPRPRQDSTSSNSLKRVKSNSLIKSNRKTSAEINVSQNNVYGFYRTIADKFPKMSLSTVMNAEEKFKAADINQDGMIDVDELDTVLMANNFLLTPTQLDAILSEVDTNNSQSVDFEEVLTVFDKLEGTQKKIPVPTDLQRKKSQICVMQ